MSIFITADLHLGHTNIIKHCNRPFKNVDEMDETLIKNWNDMVGLNDTVYVVGDFAWKNPGTYVSRLKGKKIILILGNHDKVNSCDFFDGSHEILLQKIDDKKVIFCHYSMVTWPYSHYGSYLLHGHSHGALSEDPRILRCDVGVDVWNFKPVPWEVIRFKMEQREKAIENMQEVNKRKNFSANMDILNQYWDHLGRQGIYSYEELPDE